jgi:aryl-alcohol dehydrogenase-like predicted oxidoreductase
MTFGDDWGWGSSVAESEAVIGRYLEQGGNFIDTANVYTNGHSEKIIGDYIGHERSRRDRVVIATKFVGFQYAGDPNSGGAGAKSIVRACEQSLRRLQTDYIDLYWMHCWDPFTPIDETMRALDELVASGKVRYIGFSDTPAWKAAQAQMLASFRGWAPLIGLQIEYSLLERSVEQELIPMAQELGMGVVPWGPLKSGILSGKYTRANAGKVDGRVGKRGTPIEESTYALVDQLAEIATRHAASVAAVALAWLKARAGVSSTIIGARTLDQLEANLAAVDVNLSTEDIAALDALSEPPATFTSRQRNLAEPFIHNGLTVNGVPSKPWPMGPTSEDSRY